jgi:2-amino-4-hydroxy-6-hydroxymethyldihydropteridine diphosphokinase
MSSIYETAPVGGPDQGAYLNAVVVVETDLEPRRLLDVMLDVESRMGRVRRERWGPRTIDLDLLLYGGSAVDEPGLTVPHSRLTERRFALEPLLEVWPEATLPDGRPLADFLEAVADQEVVRVASSE